MAFAVRVQNMGDFVNLICVGRLIFDEGPNTLRAAVVSQKSGRIVLDFANVDAIDAAGVGTLAALHRKVQSAGRTLIVARPRKEVLRVLRITRADSVLNLHLEQQPSRGWLRALMPLRARSCGT